MTTAQLRLDILPAPQLQLWHELGATHAEFVLYGGTAIALRLGHRQSEDFDFFSNARFVPSSLMSETKYLTGAEVVQSSANTLVCRVDRGGPVKMSFFGGLDLRRVDLPTLAEPPGIHLASLQDLGATKLKVLQDRAMAKDYLDIDALLGNGLTLTDMLGAACAVYGPAFSPLLSLKAVSYFGEPELAALPAEVKARLRTAVIGVVVDRIPLPPSEPFLR